MTTGKAAATSEPWWRIKMLWLVIGGPLAVVIASFVTLGLALTHPDEVLKPSVPPVSSSADAGLDSARVPALDARNHVQTGSK